MEGLNRQYAWLTLNHSVFFYRKEYPRDSTGLNHFRLRPIGVFREKGLVTSGTKKETFATKLQR